MATISSLGSGSGLDLQSLLTGLMQAEQQPLVALQSKEASYQSRISALGSLKGALSTLQTAAGSMIPASGTTAAAKYTSFSASVADTAIATATASTSAVAGSYSLEVSSLAKNQRLVSPANPLYTSASSAIGTGDFKIEFGSLTGTPPAGTFTADSLRSKTITIDSNNATLGGLRDAINAANFGASATIVTGTNGAQLVLSSKDTGLSSVMKLSISTTVLDTTPLTGFDYDPAANSGTMTQDVAQGGQGASNAAFTLNGIPATSSTNSITGVLDGVTLNLLKTTTTATTLAVSKNTSSGLTTTLNAFITAYNSANKAMNDLGAYDATTKTAGSLQGDSTLRIAKTQIRNLVFGATVGDTSAYQHLSNIGVSVAKDGTLSLDSSKLGAAVAADPTGVANLVAAVGSAYKSGIESLVGTSGSITSATAGANLSIKDLAKRQAALSARLTTIRANYVRQFTTLDSLIAGMKQTSNSLTQQLAAITANSSSK